MTGFYADSKSGNFIFEYYLMQTLISLRHLITIFVFLVNSALVGQLTNLLKEPTGRGTHPSEKELFAYSDRLLDSLRDNDLLYADSALTDYLYEITDQLFPGKRASIPWEIYVTTDLSPNAYALADGRLFVHAGMFVRFDQEAQLAFLLAHELAHYLYRHGAAQWEFNEGLSNKSTYGSRKRQGAFSRALERDADEIAIQLYAAAGYPPEQLDEAVRRLPAEMNLGGFLSFILNVNDKLRTHPRTPERVEYINEIREKSVFGPSYEGRNYLENTQDIRLEARKALAKDVGGGTIPYQIRMIDSLLVNLPPEELDDPFIWDLRLRQADAILKLLILSPDEANRLMVLDKNHK